MKQDGMNSQYHLIFCFIRLQLGKNFLPQLDCDYASFFHDIWKPVVITEDQTSSKICLYIPLYHNLMEIKMEILESKKLTTYHLKMHHSLSHP